MNDENSYKPIKVCIIDDDQSYREYLKVLLEDDPRFHLYGEYTKGVDFLKNLDSPFKPDVCLVDIMLPGISGIECSKVVKKKNPNIAIIIMTSHPSHETLLKAKLIGADYIEKGTIGEKLIGKIILNQSLNEKDQLVSLKVSDKNHDSMMLLAKELEIIQDRVKTLTISQKRVLLLKQTGFIKQEIAERLKLSPKTIQNHINRAEEKLMLKVNDHLFKYIILHTNKELELK